MAITILSPSILSSIAACDNQEDQLAALAAAWSGGDIIARVFAGTTLLATLTHAPWVLSSNTNPRRLTLGTRLARTFVATGVPTKVVFRAGGTDIFELTAGVGTGDVSFVASITSPAMERIDGLVITATSNLPLIPTLNLPNNAPNRVVVESWASGSAVDVGTITLDTLIRADRFADANLAADCSGWLEYGPASAAGLPVLDNVQFSAKGFDIKQGGVYGQRSFRVMVMMRAIGNNTSGQPLVDGLFGDVRGVNHYPGPHKLRILSVAGAVLKTIEMRDGLPINDSSFPPINHEWTVTSRPSTTSLPPLAPTTNDSYTSRVPDNKVFRPLVAAGSSHVAFFGDEPSSSAATRNRIPRVMEAIRPVKNTKTRSTFGGSDITATGGNGFFHPDVVPEWPWTQLQIDTSDPVAPGDPDIHNPVAYNWAAALQNGWGHEPGAHGGVTRRSGTGGIRVDRSSLPSEFYQMALTMTTRPGDGASTSAMARAHAKNQANYPGYYPKSMVTLDPIDTYSASPQPTIPGRDVTPILHYYGGNYYGTPNEVWIGDTYGDGLFGQIVEWMQPGVELNRTNKGHVRNGWMPDSEHNVRNGNAWAALLYADPVFSRMAEHIMLESSIFSPVVSKATWNIYGGPVSATVQDPGSFWSTRSNVCPFTVASMMWWVATNSGTYTRASIEERLHAFFATWKTEVLDAMPSPATATTAPQRAFAMTGGLRVEWQTWAATGNLEAGSGWVSPVGLPHMYLGQFFTIAKASGLLDVLRLNPATADGLAMLEKQLEFHAKIVASAPWAICTDSGGGPSIVLRRATQGAVQGDISTVPTTLSQVLANNPSYRADQYWFLNAAATPGVSGPSLVGNYGCYGRLQAAWAWWKYIAPTSAERTAALTAILTQVGTFKTYTPVVQESGFIRMNFLQEIPALEV